MIIVSACLIGYNCKYDGTNNISKTVGDFLKDQDFIAVCPEQLGGLPTPRPSCEIVNGKVVDTNGIDYTAAFQKGADAVLRVAQQSNARLAILQERSPSCGCHRIYDGTFTGTTIPGQGLTAKYLLENGIQVIAPTELSKFAGSTS